MKSRQPSFFQNVNNTSSFDKVKKIMDGLISYNNNIAEQILNNLDEEILQFVLYANFNIKNFPLTNKSIDANTKKILHDVCIADTKTYNAILSTIDTLHDVDATYIHIYLESQFMIKSIQNTSHKDLKDLLSRIFGSKDAATIFNKVKVKYYSSKTPLSGDVLILKEALNVLKPKVSAKCLEFVDVVTTTVTGRTSSIVGLSVGALGRYELEAVFKANIDLFDSDNLLKNLVQDYFINKDLNPQNLIYAYEKGLYLYEKFKTCHEIKNKIINRVAELKESLLHKHEVLIPTIVEEKQVLKSCPKVSINTETSILMFALNSLQHIETDFLNQPNNNSDIIEITQHELSEDTEIFTEIEDYSSYNNNNTPVYQKPIKIAREPTIQINRLNLNKN